MIHGIYHFGSKRTACRNDYCTVCLAPTFAEGRRSLVVLHFVFVPLIPLGLYTRWFCTACGKETDAKRPNRKGILISGIVFGALMTFVGATMLVVEHKPEGWVGVAMGVVLMIALAVALKSQNYDFYLTAKRAVVPLRGDVCPYCHEPVLTGITPRCHACNVKIMTQ